jgi:hypothetical protein
MPRHRRPDRRGKLAGQVVPSFRIAGGGATLSRWHRAKSELPMKSSRRYRQKIEVRPLQRAERKICRANARPVDRPVGAAAIAPSARLRNR